MGIDAVLPIAAPSQTLPVIVADRTRAWAVLVNATWYRLWVKLGTGGEGAPAAPDPSTRSQWDYEVGAGDTWKNPVPANWDGTIWVGVFSPQGALSGGLAQYATVATFAQGQDPEIASSLPATLLPQQRVVTVPVVPHVILSAETSAGVPVIGTPLRLVVLVNNGGGYTGQAITVYVYYCKAFIAGIKWATVNLLLQPTNVSGLPVGPPISSVLLQPSIGAPDTFSPGNPFAYAIPAAGGGVTSFQLWATIVEAWPNPLTSTAKLGIDVAADIDLTGQSPPPSIGNGASTTPGAVY